MSTPTKRLVLLYDGTDNTTKDDTNIWRTHELLLDRDAAGVPQLRKYIQGVGTEFGTIALGSIFGDGVAEKIREGYQWLVENYDDGAEIYIFGFSRGAFTARSIVQMIACCGLTRRNALALWTPGKAFDRYEAVTQDNAVPIWHLRFLQQYPSEKPPGWKPSQEDSLLLDDSKVREVKVKMAGLFDTVGAIGTGALKDASGQTKKAGAFNVRPTKIQEYGYHAVAIDEHRPMFDVTLWRTFMEKGKEDKTMARYTGMYEQRWFIGAHSDVGGGYHDNRLPDITLSWMLGKAAALGLAFKNPVVPQPDGWRAQVHDSFKAFAGGVLNIWDEIMPGDQKLYRTIGRVPKEVTTGAGTAGELWSINETVDESAILRWKNDPSYRPPSLEDYFKRHP